MKPIPIIVLGGSDRRPATLPEEGRDKHPLSGYKGVDLLIEGRPLIEAIEERLEACGYFHPVYVAGPQSAYGRARMRAELIDTNGSFGENIETALEQVRKRHPGLPVAFTTCDILPEVETLRSVMSLYDQDGPFDLWFPVIRSPVDSSKLGASGWKPSYRIRKARHERPVSVLPGHLIVADPEALRLPFLYRLFQLGYRTRNRSINQRRAVMLRGVLAELMYQDLRHLVGLRLPVLTWTVLTTGFSAAAKLKAGAMSSTRLEQAVRRVFVKRIHQDEHPSRRVSLPVVDGLSLALDIDTREEALERGWRTVDASPAI